MLLKKINLGSLYIFFICLFVFFIKFSTNNLFASIFKVQDIEIIEPYETNFSKSKVIDLAIEKAFIKLTSKIILSKDYKKFSKPKINIIRKFVDSFAIVDEKFINNNYIAFFEVDFSRSDVINFFEKKNIITSVPLKKNIFILPIFIDLEKKQVSLFSENFFYNKWNLENQDYYLLNYILPNEDLEDLKIIQKNLHVLERYEFKEIISKYDLKDFIIVIFFKNENNIKILSKINLNKNLSIINSNIDNFDYNEKNTLDVIRELKINYEDKWKQINQVNPSINLQLTLGIKTKNYKLIEKFEKKSNESYLISKFYIYKFSNNETIYKVIYNGTPDKFLSEFENYGFKIDKNKDIWKIE